MSMDREERRQMARQHIFAVNSSIEFLYLFRELFQDEQYNITTTNLVPQTFEQIAALQPDLLIVDLAVGVRAGWDLLENLQRQAVTNQIPVIVTTTSPDLLDKAQAQQAKYGSQRLVAKSFEADELLAAVQDLIGQA